MTTIYEVPDSREVDNDEPSILVHMNVEGEVDEWLANEYVWNNTPTTYDHQRGVLKRGWWRLQPLGFKLFRASIPYRKRSIEPNDYTFNFDTTGGMIHLTCAKEHIADYAAPGDPAGNNINQHGGVIGVTDNGEVEGTDIYAPALKMNYGFRFPEGVVNSTLARTLARATGKTNSDIWDGFQVGELLYIGSTGSDGRDAEAAVDFHLLASENATGLTIGDIVGIAKKGWEYLWVSYIPNVVGGKAARIPDRVFVERVFDPVNFANTFGWSP
jgi:hypothetical protein